MLEPWYKAAVPRREVREGRSFGPDEFAIALEQVVAGTAPEDYSKPEQFFSRTCFTRALKDHASMVLRRLSGETINTAPVLTLITQFGGGKTHTLAALYHLANAGSHAVELPGVPALLDGAGLAMTPAARVGVFVGNAWDPSPGHETPWIDLARQIAGDKGVAVFGPAAKTTPPGTEAIGRVFAAAEAPVLVLLDEVLNFVNRHRGMAESLHAFIQNLTVAITGTTHAAAVISLPRSQVEMTDWDQQWQERITKVVRRVAQDLIANDEAEIGDVVLGAEFDRADRAEVQTKMKDAEEAAKDEVWSGYRYIILSDTKSPKGLKVIDLGAGHASASETLCGRIIAALKTEALLNDSIGAGYIDRHWPRAFQESGAWRSAACGKAFSMER
jgi:hypothetical protein